MSHPGLSLPGTWMPNIYSQTPGTTPMSAVPPYPGSSALYMSQYYHQSSTYEGYGMMLRANAYQQSPIPGGADSLVTSPTSNSTHTSGYDSLVTSPTNSANTSGYGTSSPGSQDNKITGVLTKTTGGRIRKKPLESGKPPYSYISLICMAIAGAPEKKATLREICDYIKGRFPFYQEKKNWEGNIRHNLTLNDCFVKMPRRAGDKGHPWAINPTFEDMYDGGSLLRRRYRFKEGSEKWKKSQKAAQRLAMGSPKKRARKAKDIPKNALVVTQPDGTSKPVVMNERAMQSEQSEKGQCCVVNETVPVKTESVTRPNDTSQTVPEYQGTTSWHQIPWESSSSFFDLSSSEPKIVKTENKTGNSSGSSFASPDSGVTALDSSASAADSNMRSPTDQHQASNYPALKTSFEPFGRQQQHGSPVYQPQNDLSDPQVSPGSLHQSPEFPANSSVNITSPYQYYRNYATCYPMASSTPTPASSYPVPLGGSYLSSPCSTGSQLYQGLQADYYNLLSSPKFQ